MNKDDRPSILIPLAVLVLAIGLFLNVVLLDAGQEKRLDALEEAVYGEEGEGYPGGLSWDGESFRWNGEIIEVDKEGR